MPCACTEAYHDVDTLLLGCQGHQGNECVHGTGGISPYHWYSCGLHAWDSLRCNKNIDAALVSSQK